MLKPRVLVSLALLTGGLLFSAGGLWAQEKEMISADQFSFALDMVWVILCGSLVFFMQAGFAMLETGLTRAKNAANVIMKNVLDFCVGAVAFWAVGWAVMFGADNFGLFGSSGFFLNYGPGGPTGAGAGITGATSPELTMSGIMRNWMFQVVFAGTSATIVSGAMAERTTFHGYLLVTLMISALIYPVSGHWIWGGGWLSEMGFHDFAGSTVVHSVGGWAALAGAAVLGARQGRYFKDADGVHSRPIPGHNIPMSALGMFILWFGWYGFNCGSTLSGSASTIGYIAVNTTLAAAAGTIGAMAVSWVWFKKPDPSITLNGALAGLVGITAGCDAVSSLGAIIIGLVAGILIIFSIEFIDRILHIDDPVGAISVHGLGGAWGTIAVGFFADGIANPDVVGVLYGGEPTQLHAQVVGVGAVLAWTVIVSFALFFLVKITVGLRVKEKEERQGLDLGEHKTEAYHGFQFFSN